MSTQSTGRSRLGFITLAVLFLGPLIGAYTAYYLGWQPGGQTAHGELLSPARPLPEQTLLGLDGQKPAGDPVREMWTLLYVGDAQCDAGCEKTLYNMRQVWKSLGRKRKRVQGTYLLTDEPTPELRSFLETEHQGMTVARPATSPQPWLEFFSMDGQLQPLQSDNIYVIDPLGNWVLLFRPDDEPKGLLKDLKKLLRLSNIG